MMTATWLILAGFTLTALTNDVPRQQELRAQVDPRIELISIIFRLAGNPEYNEPKSKSPYADEVDAHFGKYRDHPVVRTARQMRAKRGISYDAVTSMAVHLKDTITVTELVPFDKQPCSLERRWQPDEARTFLRQAHRFAQETGFNQFVSTHQELYEAAGDRMIEILVKHDYLEWLNSFFGPRPRANLSVIVSMLDGPYGRGVRVLYPDEHEEIIAVLGMTHFDGRGIPIISDTIGPWLVHEFSHSYVNPLVDKYANELAPAGERIFSHCQEVMEQQAYGKWQIMLYESLVRASVVRYVLSVDGRAAAKQLAREDYNHGFKWIGPLVKLLGEYESDRKQYPTMAAFMPRVVTFFNNYAEEQDRVAASAPHVVSIVPANGSANVDPHLMAIKITFDRPMMDKSWGLIGDPVHTPEVIGELSYDSAYKVLTIPIRLKSDWSYEFWLNTAKYQNFRSRDGIVLEPVKVTFKTRKE